MTIVLSHYNSEYIIMCSDSLITGTNNSYNCKGIYSKKFNIGIHAYGTLNFRDFKEMDGFIKWINKIFEELPQNSDFDSIVLTFLTKINTDFNKNSDKKKSFGIHIGGFMKSYPKVIDISNRGEGKIDFQAKKIDIQLQDDFTIKNNTPSSNLLIGGTYEFLSIGLENLAKYYEYISSLLAISKESFPDKFTETPKIENRILFDMRFFSDVLSQYISLMDKFGVKKIIDYPINSIGFTNSRFVIHKNFS